MIPLIALAVFVGVVTSSGVPSYTGPALNASLKLGGIQPIPGVINVPVCRGDPSYGTYNHAAMIDYHDSLFLIAWKNGAVGEDDSNQRILYSTSTDGVTWTKTDGSNVLFPGMSTKEKEGALFVGPPIVVNNRRYVGASVGQAPAGAAQGAQFCLWPDPLEPRNTVIPTKKYSEHKDVLLMRRVYSNGQLGDIFWQREMPKDWKDASKVLDIKTLSEMDETTQADMEAINAASPSAAFCSTSGGTLKCEACTGGCQLWKDIPAPQNSVIGNERAHYNVPNTTDEDVILYRAGAEPFLYASSRKGVRQSDWEAPIRTSIPNDESNLNTGPLPDGRVYLVHNPVFEPKLDTPADKADLSPFTLRFRDPVAVSTSKDGYAFGKYAAVMSCTSLSSWSKCTPRYHGDGKNPGPSYPQGLTVVHPAPPAIQGFYVVATNNKEDVWVSKVPFDAF